MNDKIKILLKNEIKIDKKKEEPVSENSQNKTDHNTLPIIKQPKKKKIMLSSKIKLQTNNKSNNIKLDEIIENEKIINNNQQISNSLKLISLIPKELNSDRKKTNDMNSNTLKTNKLKINHLNSNLLKNNELIMDQVKSNLFKTNEINFNEIKENIIHKKTKNVNEIKTNEINSNEINTNIINEIKTIELNSNETNSNEINVNEKNLNEINSNKINGDEINYNEIKTNDVKSKEINSIEIKINENNLKEIKRDEVKINDLNKIKNSNGIKKNEININEKDFNEIKTKNINLNEINSNENSNEINLNEINSNENSNEINLNEINSNENSNEIKINEINSNETSDVIKTNEINTNEATNEIKINEINTNEATNEIKKNEINTNEATNEIKINEINTIETSNEIKTNDLNTKKTSNDINSNLNPSIEELLLNDSLITEITYMHSPQHSFYFTSNNIIKLIDFSTHMPYIDDDEILTHKFPFNSCELLKSDAEYIYNKFFEDNLDNFDNINLSISITKKYKILIHFLEFLDNTNNNSNELLCGYFSKILISLLEKKGNLILNILFDEDYISQMIDLCTNLSICDCVKNILIMENEDEEIINKKTIILKKLFGKIYNIEYSDNICSGILNCLLYDEINEIFISLLLKNFDIIKDNIKIKGINKYIFEFLNYLTQTITDCFSKTKENTLLIDGKRRIELDNYVLEHYEIYLNYLNDICESILSNIEDTIKDKIDNKILKYLILNTIDILASYINCISFVENNNVYINNINSIIQENILLNMTQYIFSNPLYTLYHNSFVNFIQSISRINSKILLNEKFLFIFQDYLISEYQNSPSFLGHVIKIMDIIYQSNIINDKLPKDFRLLCDFIVKPIINIFNQKLLYEEEKKLNNSDSDIDKKLNIVSTPENYINIISLKEIVLRGLSDYNKELFKNKLVQSNESIGEEIDLDINDDSENDNLNIGNLNINELNLSDDEINDLDDSIGEIIRSTQKEIENIRKSQNKEKKEIKENNVIEKYNDNIFWSTPFNLDEKEMDDLINNIN